MFENGIASSERLDTQVEELLYVLKEQADNPNRPDTDEYISPFYDVAYRLLVDKSSADDEQSLTEAVRYSLDKRYEIGHEVDMLTFSKLLFRCVHKQVLRKMGDPKRDRAVFPDYPGDEYTRPDTWETIITQILKNPKDDVSFDEFHSDLITRDVQSNVPSRVVGPALIMASEHERLGDTPTILEVGCSAMLLLKKLATGGKFRHIDVCERVRGSGNERVNEAFTRLVNAKLAHEFRIGYGLGIDIADFTNNYYRNHTEWIRACSIRPRELLNPDMVEEWDALKSIDIHNHNLDFVRGSFTFDGWKDFEKKLPQKQFDLVILPTMLYMLSRKEKMEARALAREFVTPNGLIAYQDFAYVNQQDKRKLSFFRDWGQKWAYRTIIEDPQVKNNELHEVFQWGGGRCRDMMLGKSITQLALGRELEALAD